MDNRLVSGVSPDGRTVSFWTTRSQEPIDCVSESLLYATKARVDQQLMDEPPASYPQHRGPRGCGIKLGASHFGNCDGSPIAIPSNSTECGEHYGS
jgi:hypothetical protein